MKLTIIINIICVFFLFSKIAVADLDDLEEFDGTATEAEAEKPIPRATKTKKKPGANSNPSRLPKPDLNPELKRNSQTKSEATTGPTISTPVKKTPKENQRIKTAPEEKDSGAKHPVHLKSQGLRAQKDGGMVELQEDVHITQGPLSLKADYSKVFVDPETNEVLRANAEGNVKLNKESDDPAEVIRAKAKTATFFNKERKVVLRGDAQLWRGNSLLKGKKIVYDLATGWITFDSAEGVMQPEKAKAN